MIGRNNKIKVPGQLWRIPFFWIEGTIVAGQSLIFLLAGNEMNQWIL
jgi:hypothetical protein